MPRKNHKIGLLLICFLSFIYINILNSCNDQPTDIAYTLLYDTISIYPISSFDAPLISEVKSYQKNLSLVNVGYMLLGKTDEMKAISLVRFQDVPDTLSHLTTADIDSVFIHIYPFRYIIGDSLNQRMPFTIHKVTKLWTTQTTWDTLYSNGDVSDYFDTKVLGTYNAKIPLLDTSEAIRIPLDKELIVEWLQLRPDTNAPVINYGIALLPDDNSNVIRQFSSQAIGKTHKQPVIYVYYRNKDNEGRLLYLRSAMDASFVKAPKEEEPVITVQGASSYRGQMTFDLSNIPDIASIHTAKLYMKLNRDKTKVGNYGIDSYILAEINDTTISATEKPQYVALRDSTDYIYKFNQINSSVEWWLKHGKKGSMTFFVYGYENEVGRLDRLSFYGLDEKDSANKPVIKIIYSIRNLKCNQ